MKSHCDAAAALTLLVKAVVCSAVSCACVKHGQPCRREEHINYNVRLAAFALTDVGDGQGVVAAAFSGNAAVVVGDAGAGGRVRIARAVKSRAFEAPTAGLVALAKITEGNHEGNSHAREGIHTSGRNYCVGTRSSCK